MEITITPEELKKYEAAVKEHTGRKFQHFAEALLAFHDPSGLTPPAAVLKRAMDHHKAHFEGKFPTISHTFGLD